MVNTRVAANNSAFLSPSRQDSMMTDDVDMMNVMNDVEINDEEDIDNVSVGGMDVSDIEDNEHHNGHSNHVNHRQQVGVGRGRPAPAQRPPALGQQKRQQQQPPPRPPGGRGFQPVPPHPPPTAPSYTRPLVGGVVCIQYWGWGRGVTTVLSHSDFSHRKFRSLSLPGESQL